MSWLPWRRRRRNEELQEEIQGHLLLAEREALESGRSAREACSAALREFGNVDLAAEGARDTWSGRWLAELLQDLRIGVRMLRHNPGFAGLAILCLTLGIGANAAVFSWMEGVLLRPYPLVQHQDRMYALSGESRGTPGNTDISWLDFQDFARNCRLESSFIAEKITGAKLNFGDQAETAIGSMVSANYFDALGIHLVLGRGFEPEDDFGRNAHPVTVISYQFWQDRYRGDPGVIGKTQILNGIPHTIIGVAPKGFYGTFVGYAFQFWAPVSMQEAFDPTGYKLEDRGARWIEGFVILKPGVTRQQAQEEISAVAARLERAYPETNRGFVVRLYPLWQTPFNNAGALAPALGFSLVVVVFVLLIACANVGNLMLVRAFARRREMTIRQAIGAGRTRLLKQLLTEGLILSAMAGVGGLLVAWWCRNLLVLIIPWRGVPMYLPGELDWRVFAVVAGVALLATLLFALAPALQAARIDLSSALRADAAGVVVGRGRGWIRSGLVVLQVSLSFLLLVGAGLVLKSILRIRDTSPGFSTRHVLTTSVGLSAAGYDVQRARNFQNELLTQVQGLPGVESAAYARITPFSYLDYSSTPIAVDGYVPPPDQLPSVDYDEVSPGYFATMGIPLLSGREFTRADDEDAAPVAIVNELMVQQFWRGRDPVGQRLQMKGRWLRVVGVAKLSKYRNFFETPQPFFYVPLRQNFFLRVGLDIRTTQPPQAIAPALAREIHLLDPKLSLYEVITLREQVMRTTSSQSIAVTLLTVFGGLALVLAAIGLYGVMSNAVSQGAREMGLRMALGARPADLLRLVLRQGLMLTAVGLALGAGAALLLTRLLGYLLFHVSPRDPLAFGSASGLMILVSLAASLFPAWRATRTDPVSSLRA